MEGEEGRTDTIEVCHILKKLEEILRAIEENSFDSCYRSIIFRGDCGFVEEGEGCFCVRCLA